MKLLPKMLITGLTTVGAGLIGAATVFDENAVGMLYTGYLGVMGGTLFGVGSCMTETSHRNILCIQFLASVASMGITTAFIETNPNYAGLHTPDAQKTVQLDAAPVAKIPANTYVM